MSLTMQKLMAVQAMMSADLLKYDDRDTIDLPWSFVRAFLRGNGIAAHGIPSFRKRNQRQRRRDHRRIYCHGRKGGRK